MGHPGRQWRETHNGAHVGHPQMHQTGQHYNNLIWRIVTTISLFILVHATRDHTQQTQRLSPPEGPSAHNYRVPADTRQGMQPNTVIRGKGLTGVTVVAEMSTAIKATSNNQMESATTAQSIGDMDLPSPRVQATSQTQMDYPKTISGTIYNEYYITSTTASRCTRRPAK